MNNYVAVIRTRQGCLICIVSLVTNEDREFITICIITIRTPVQVDMPSIILSSAKRYL